MVKEKTEPMTRAEKMIVAIQFVNNPKKSVMMGFYRSFLCVMIKFTKAFKRNNGTIVQ